MTLEPDIAISSPEPLDGLVAAYPPKALLSAITEDPLLARTVLAGFSARPPTLGLPVVRQRLLRELAQTPELTERLFAAWMAMYADVLAQLNDETLPADAEALAPLLRAHGLPVLRYALHHTDRPALHTLAETLSDTPPTPAAPPPVPVKADKSDALRAQLTEARQQVQALEAERTALQREVARIAREADDGLLREAELTKQVRDFSERLEREARKARKAEEEGASLGKQLRQAARAVTAPPTPPSPELLAAVTQAIAILQRALPGTVPVVAAAAPPPPPPPPPAPPKRHTPEPSLTLQTPHGKRHVTLAGVRTALLRNDLAVVNDVRDGLAYLASQPAKERIALDALAQTGIPMCVLTGPLRPALIDGSNVANMSPGRRARLEYLEQIRQSAWEEGYFPAEIIVDASLPHQIDDPDRLMAMVERGEVRMVTPGTSADEVLIAEAAAHNAVLITNDRLANWPAARELQKRHAEMYRDKVRVGNFHRSGLWLPW